MTRVLHVGALVLGTAVVCAAQSGSLAPELVTDRPDFTESSEVVGRHVVQIESGLTVEQTDAATRQVTAPQMLVRVGLGSRFELRFAGDGFLSQSLQTPAGRVWTSGRSDLELGGKLKFLEGGSFPLDMAVIPFVSLPTASAGVGSGGYDAGFKITAARDLIGGFGLSGNFNAASVRSQTGRTWEREASLSLAHGLGGPFGAYWETFGTRAGGRCDCTINTGVTMALGANGQIDVEAGRGVAGQAQDWFVGVGFAVRRLR